MGYLFVLGCNLSNCLLVCGWFPRSSNWHLSEQSELLEWDRSSSKEQWNVGQVSETEWKKKKSQWDRVSVGSLSADCVLFLFFFSSFSIYFYFFGACESSTPSLKIPTWYRPTSWQAQKNPSLCCCECQSKKSAQQGLPWVTPRRLVRACEMDDSLGGLSSLMTRFPGICAAALRPGSPSKELCNGAVLPLHCYQSHGGTGG